MQRTCFKDMPCPIARSLEKVGEWWSILILYEAHRGVTRFDEFQKRLGIGTNTLTRRLGALVEQGLLTREPYSEKPLRHEYRLTPAGHDFEPVLRAIQSWGRKHTQASPAPSAAAS